MTTHSPTPSEDNPHRGRFFGHGDLRLVVLWLLSEGDSHGYELIKAIESLTEGHYVPSPGVIYPTLDHLAQLGLVALTDGENSRKNIALTPQGQRYLAAEQPHLAKIQARIKARTIGHALRRHPEMKRVLGNLKETLDRVVNQQAISEAQLEEVVAILDGAARAVALLGGK